MELGLRAHFVPNDRVVALTPYEPPPLWTTKTDEMVDCRNSELFADALAKHGIEHGLDVFPAGPHGRGLSRAETHAREWPELYLAWLERQGFREAPTPG